jgi:hypothetical protein
MQYVNERNARTTNHARRISGGAEKPHSQTLVVVTRHRRVSRRRASGVAGAVCRCRLNPDFSVLFRSIIFILGLFIFVGGVWGLRYAKNLKLEDLIPTPEAVEFARQAQLTTPYFTYLLVGLIVAVTLFQMSVEYANRVTSLV